MFANNSTMVIGAGASKDVDLPTGYELKMRIMDSLDFEYDFEAQRFTSGNHLIRSSLAAIAKETRNQAITEGALLEAATFISRAMPQFASIDNFVHDNAGNKPIEICSKVAIAHEILAAERHSPLFIDHTMANNAINMRSLENTWFNTFMALLTENCPIDKLADRLNSLTIVNFNYDRCFEHFLYHSIVNCYRVDASDAADLVGKMNIFHPYGSLGPLEWTDDADSILFGGSIDAVSVNDLVKAFKKIRTFTEGTDPASSNIEMIRSSLAESRVVLFLGFGFHSINLEILDPGDSTVHTAPGIEYFATAKGISESDRELVRAALSKLTGAVRESIHLNDVTCKELFEEYWRKLAFH